MRLRVGAGTSTGQVRELNEDVYMVRATQGVFLVCDGMGGAPDGEVASRIAAQTILEELDRTFLELDVSARENERHFLPHTSRLAEAVRRSNHVIYAHGQRDVRQAEMGTTVVSAWLKEHVASVAHVGDSRAYLWHDNRLDSLTRDHSLVEALIRDGMGEAEMNMPGDQQNILLRVLGGEPEVEVDVTEVPLQPGDYLLLCSDGLTRMVPDRTLAEAISDLRDPQRICDYLIDAANRNGGTDNITVVVVEVVGSWWRRLSNRWRQYATGGRHAAAHPQV